MEIKSGMVKDFIVKNRLEIMSVISLVLLFLMFIALGFGNSLGCILIDIGREASFPQQILEGKILYKDIFNIFGPLSYQMNAVFYKILGVNLKTLYLVGSLNALLTTLLAYSISRLFTSKGVSWIVTVFIMLTCVFCPWFVNEIFPYSYAATYALNAVLFSILFLMLYLKTSKQFFIPLSFFFVGVSLALKYEYLTYTLLIFSLVIYAKIVGKVQIKYILLSLISFFIVPIISFSILFIQGLTIDELFKQLFFVKKYATSPSLNYFYHNLSGLYPNKYNLIIVLQTFGKVFIGSFLLMTLIYFSLKFSKNIFKDYKKLILSLSSAALIFFILCKNTQEYQYFNLSWVTLFTFFIFCFVLKDKLSNKKVYDNGIYLLFIICALITSQKSFFFLSFLPYALYALPLLSIVNSIFIVEYLPRRFKVIDKELMKSSFMIFFGVLILVIFISLKTAADTSIVVKGAQGEIGDTLSTEAIVTNQVIKYIEKNLKPTDAVWVIPEGSIINFLTNRPSNGIYYNMTTPYLEAFGENKIISDTKKNPPEYIIINNRDSSAYGAKYMCDDYGYKICNYVKSSYIPVKTYIEKHSGEWTYKMHIYKRKIN